MTDRELLELAAKAAGMTVASAGQAERDKILGRENASLWIDGGSTAWNPLRNGSDALRLAVHLRIDIYPWIHDSADDVSAMARTPHGQRFIEFKAGSGGCKYAATRRAITRAAAEIGRAME